MAKLSAAVVAALATLTDALDDPGADIAQSVRQLASDAHVAVSSYLGLSVTIVGDVGPATFNAFQDGAHPGDIRASLAMGLTPEPWAGPAPPAPITLVLYAATAGAFVDMGADLSWLGEAVVVDQHLAVEQSVTGPRILQELSSINQAIGLLIGDGHTPEQADAAIDIEAARLGTGRGAAAASILAARLPLMLEPD